METMGAASHGPLHCLWALGASSPLLLLSLPLTAPMTHSIGLLALVLRCLCLLSDGASLIVQPPVVQRCLHLRLFLRLCLLSYLHLSLRPSCLVGCCVSQRLSLSLSLYLRLAPRPPPFIMPRPFVAPLSFGWLLLCLVPPSPSCCNSAQCHLLSLPSCLIGLLHCPVPLPIIQMVVMLPLMTPLLPVNLCLSLSSRHTSASGGQYGTVG